MTRLSEVLWKNEPHAEARRTPASGDEKETPNVDPALREVPVVEVTITPENRIALISDPRGAGADRFRFLRMKLQEARGLVKLRNLVITSALPEDGKSTMAINLATALADRGRQSVLLVEADLHHPTIAQSLGIPRRAGFAECVESGVDPIANLARVEPLSCYLLQAGRTEGNPTDLLQSERVSEIVTQLSSLFDWVLFDTPPVMPLTDALSLSHQVDASLLVVRAHATPPHAVEEALSRIGRKNVLGAIFNGADDLNRLYSKYYSHYGVK